MSRQQKRLAGPQLGDLFCAEFQNRSILVQAAKSVVEILVLKADKIGTLETKKLVAMRWKRKWSSERKEVVGFSMKEQAPAGDVWKDAPFNGKERLCSLHTPALPQTSNDDESSRIADNRTDQE